MRSNIIVVDNQSTDGTESFIRKNYPEVDLVVSDKNLGFGKANNVGIEKALKGKADYVFLLNQDAWVKEDTIKGLIDIHKSNGSFGILSPMHLNGSGTALDSSFEQYCSNKHCKGFFSDKCLDRTSYVYPISFVNAAFWLVPVECLLKVGLFDPLFPHYGEDVDYVNRIKYHGFEVAICPEFIGYHDRQDRKPSQKRDLLIKHTGYIGTLKNVGLMYSTAIKIVCKQSLKSLASRVLSLEINTALMECRDFGKLLLLIPAIAKSRKASIRGAAYFSEN